MLDDLRRQASAHVRQRLGALLALSDEALLHLPERSTEELSISGVKTQCITWHEAKPDGSHWVSVELWETHLLNSVVAAEGIALSQGVRRPLTAEELSQGL